MTVKTARAAAPAHVHADPAAKQHLCGAKADTLPYVGAAHVVAHIEGWRMPVCDACWAVFTADLAASAVQQTLFDPVLETAETAGLETTR